MPPVSGIVDEAVASRFAAMFAQPGSLDQSYLLDGLQESFEALTREAEPLIAEESGFISPHPAVARVLSRQEWATNNVASMLELMSPLLGKVQQKLDNTPAFPGARFAYKAALGAQLGTVLGFLSQRVLGQYDILMAHQNQVWFVGPNIVMMERRFGFLPRDFRLWIVLHELTHRGQFEANSWVRPHFLGMVNEMLASMDMDAKTLADRMLSSFKSNPRDAGGDGAPIVFRMLEPQQLEIFNRLQAFMSVIEGHGNFVMDRVGEGRIPSQPRMSQALRGGGTVGSPLARLMAKVLGFELKKAQYVQGQMFFDAVYATSGSAGVKSVFQSVEALPTLEEVKSPERWLSRVAP